MSPLTPPGVVGAASAMALALSLFPLRAPAAPAGEWAGEAAILARIHPPAFPDRTFPITEFGAAPGGADCTAAIRRAIEACHAAGGGHVVVPAGVFATGGITLLSGVDLHLDAGATLRFLTDPAAYLPAVFTRWEGTECMNYQSLIYAYGQEGVAVTGSGTLDGSAGNDNWWAWARHARGRPAPAEADRRLLVALADRGVPPEDRVFGAGHRLRPNFIQCYRCRDVLIEGVTIVRSPMWEIHPVLCTNVTVEGVRIYSLGPNNDGCDPESCRDVLIDGCQFNTGDDCISIKSGRNDDGRRLNVPTENLVIRRCAMKDGHAGVAIGSEVSGGCRDVYVEDCAMDSPHLVCVLRFKSNAERGGVVQDVFLRDLRVGTLAESVVTIDFLYEEGARGAFRPVVRDVDIDRLVAAHAPRIFFIAGFPGATIDDIRIRHSVIAGLDEPEVIEHAGRIELDDVVATPARPARILNDRDFE